MGCGSSTEDRQFMSLDQQYQELGLMNTLTGQFDTDLERQIFMAINICRANPHSFIPIVNMVKKTNVLAQ